MVSVKLDEVSRLITQKLGTTVESFSLNVPVCKAVSALLPFAARPEQHGRYLTLDALLHVLRTCEGVLWDPIVPALFSRINPPTIILISPHVRWVSTSLADRESLVTQWAAAASAALYTEEVGQSVVDVLLQVSPWPFLLSRIPVDIWGWLKKRPSLPPKCHGRTLGSEDCVVRHVRALGDIEILKSYLLLVWSEWDSPWGSSYMCAVIREDFGGVEMRGHREDLLKHLDHVLGQLDRGLGYLRRQNRNLSSQLFQEAKEGYRMIKGELLEVDREAMETQTCTPAR